MTDSHPSGAAPASVTIRRRVEWPDTDAAGRYHHSTVIRWVEAAEAELFEAVGLLDSFGSVPRVHYEVDYLAPVFFRDEVELTLIVESVGAASLRYTFEVRQPPADETGRVVARGALVAVLIGAGESGPADWGDESRQRLLTSGQIGSRPAEASHAGTPGIPPGKKPAS